MLAVEVCESSTLRENVVSYKLGGRDEGEVREAPLRHLLQLERPAILGKWRGVTCYVRSVAFHIWKPPGPVPQQGREAADPFAYKPPVRLQLTSCLQFDTS